MRRNFWMGLAFAMSLMLAQAAVCSAQERLGIVPEPFKTVFSGEDPIPFRSVEKVQTELWEPRLDAALQKAFGMAPNIIDAENMGAHGGLVVSLLPLDSIPKETCDAVQCDAGILKGSYMPTQGPTVVNESYLLEVAPKGFGLGARIYSDTPNGRFYAIKTLTAIVKLNEAQAMRPMVVFDYPSIAIRGILEGYYGKPWSKDDTLKILDFAGDFKLNIFIYAPKDDPKNRALWRQPYSKREMDQFVLYSQKAHENFVNFCWQLSPGQSIFYSNEKDYQAVLNKFKSIIDLGIDCFNIAFDDVEPTLKGEDAGKFETYAEAQVYLTNRLHDDVKQLRPDARFSFVPQQYSNAQIQGDYLDRLGKGLYQDIIIGWTGNDICALEIIPADADLFAAKIRRKPLLGDNFPVVDSYLTRETLHMGFLVNRSPELPSHIMGFVANAMPWALSSRVALGTIVDYAWNTNRYNPQISWRNTARLLVGSKAFEPFMKFIGENQASLIWPHDNPETVKFIDDFWAAYKAGDLGPVRERWMTKFSGLAKVNAELKDTITDKAFLDEISYWVTKLSASAELAMAACDILDAKLKGSLTPEKLEEYKKIRAAANSRQGVVAKFTFPDFFKKVDAELGI